MVKHRVSYIELFHKGILEERIKTLENIYQECTLCPHQCKVNRFKTKQGFCQTGHLPTIDSASAHFGEEAPLVGKNGSGTIFFSGCNMRCIYCQNYDTSRNLYGKEVSYHELAEIMLFLQDNRGCHNINFVSPSHMLFAVLKSLKIAIEKGLNIPLVYNSGGYDSLESLQLMHGIFDIYMPDIKYADNRVAEKLSGIKNYKTIAFRALEEMHRQVGDLKVNHHGVAEKGLIVRHLVLPQDLSQSKKVIDFVAKVSSNTYFNLMDQYHPAGDIHPVQELKGWIDIATYYELVDYAKAKGIRRLD